MSPEQFTQYQQALHLEDRFLGLQLGMEFEEGGIAVPAMRNGERPIEDWIEVELEYYLGVFWREYQRLESLHEQGKMYALVPPHAIKDEEFYRSIVVYNPVERPEAEIDFWMEKHEMRQIHRHLQALEGGVTLVKFDVAQDVIQAIGADLFTEFDEWVQGYNNFIRYVAGELRAKQTPYICISYSCPYNGMEQIKQVKTSLREAMKEDCTRVVPFRADIDVSAYNDEEMLADLNDTEANVDASWRLLLENSKAEADRIASAYSTWF